MFQKFALFQRSAPMSSSQAKRAHFWVWNLLCVVLSGLALGLLSLILAPGSNRLPMFISYLEHPLLLIFNVAPVLLLILALYFLLGRAPLAYWFTALVVGGATTANVFKLLLRNDPLIFEDVLLWKEATNMAGEYSLYFTKSLALALVIALFIGIALHFVARGRLRGVTPYRFFGLTFCLLAVLPLQQQIASDANYTTHTTNITYINQWSSTQVYYSKGFVYPFLYSVKSAFVTPPDHYDPNRVEELLAAYPTVDLDEDEKVSVISIMLEAYADLSPYGIDGLSDRVYADYHALEAESYSGTLVTNIFAGGTVDSERCYLTGYVNLRNFRSNVNAYPWYFKSQGYTVTGAHPCFEWFYNRQNINQYLGFDDYWFVENHYAPLTDGGVGYDNIFFPSLLEMWETNLPTGNPLFAYNLTYQGHGPYSTDRTWWGDDYVVSDRYSQESLNILNNYFGSIYDTNQHLVDFFDYYRQAEEPVVIVLFGDHKPWLGDGNSVYNELGMVFDMATKEGFYEYYSTQYLIWANDAAKETLGQDFVGDGPDISANYLMNLVFDQANWTGPSFLQATNPVLAQVPVQNSATGLFVEDGALTATLSPQGQSLVDDFAMLEYYQQKNFTLPDGFHP